MTAGAEILTGDLGPLFLEVTWKPLVLEISEPLSWFVYGRFWN